MNNDPLNIVRILVRIDIRHAPPEKYHDCGLSTVLEGKA